jgi:hypothetical protein
MRDGTPAVAALDVAVASDKPDASAEDRRSARTKPEIALAEIDRMSRSCAAPQPLCPEAV